MNATSNQSWNDALDQFEIGYDVEKRPLFVELGQGSKAVDNLYSIVRTDTQQPLPGVAVNGRYTCIQTREYAEIGEKIVGELGAKFVAGGQLMGGRGLFLQAKLPESIRVRGTDDIIDKNLTFVTSHDGSLCFMLMATALRLFCDNQMNALQRDARDGVKIRHTASAESRLLNADQNIMEVLGAYKGLELKVNFLADQTFSDLQMADVIAEVFSVKDINGEVATRTKNNIIKVKDNFESGLGIDADNRGTAWAAYNSFTQFSDHQRTMKKGTDPFEAGLLGSGATFKFKALRAIENSLQA